METVVQQGGWFCKKSIPDAKEKPGWFKRMLMWVLPEKTHKYLTPEAFVAYQVSGFISFWQGFAAAKWDDILVWAAPKLELIKPYWMALKKGFSELVDLVSATH